MMYESFEQCSQQLQGVVAVDFYLACQLCREYQQQDNADFFHLVLAVHQFLRQGHSCLPLSEVAGLQWFTGSEAEDVEKVGYRFSELETLRDGLQRLPATDCAFISIEDDCVYLQRYLTYEQEIANDLKNRMLAEPLSKSQMASVSELLAKSYPPSDKTSSDSEINWSKVAVANALGRRFSMITGGPGTGKTFTATRLLLALQAMHDGNLHISMAAPTGKAAQRLKESIAKGKADLMEMGVAAHLIETIPDEAKTIHRLLGYRPRSVQPRHGVEQPLRCDVLLLDEVSMIDLPMMARLLRALPAETTLLMLGDANQLPSVEVGSVMAELTTLTGKGYRSTSAAQIFELTGEQVPVDDDAVFDHVTVLRKSWRFGGEIGTLATQVIDGLYQESSTLLQSRQQGETHFNHPAGVQTTWINDTLADSWLAAATKHFFATIRQANTLERAFDTLAKFRILTPTRVGQNGVEALNRQIESLLARSNSTVRSGQHYQGRPIMVTENNYSNQLFNGDIALVWPNAKGKLVAWFEQGNDAEGRMRYREVSLARLPHVETVYAMTIHKTQGSEFSHVAIALPEQDSELLSRELLYTGITRAKQHVYILGKKSVWSRAVQRQAKRFSGLGKRMAG